MCRQGVGKPEEIMRFPGARDGVGRVTIPRAQQTRAGSSEWGPGGGRDGDLSPWGWDGGQ